MMMISMMTILFFSIMIMMKYDDGGCQHVDDDDFGSFDILESGEMLDLFNAYAHAHVKIVLRCAYESPAPMLVSVDIT